MVDVTAVGGTHGVVLPQVITYCDCILDTPYTEALPMFVIKSAHVFTVASKVRTITAFAKMGPATVGHVIVEPVNTPTSEILVIVFNCAGTGSEMIKSNAESKCAVYAESACCDPLP